jgi:branched-chain amino acid transport system substrate-binding protein
VEISEETKDATPQALKLQGSGAEVVLMLARPKAAAVLVRDAAKIGYKPLWVAQTAIADLVAFKQQVGIPGAIENMITITQTLYQPSDPQMEEWRKRVQVMYPSDNLSPYTLNGIAGGMVFAEALKRAGRNVTRDKFLEAVGSLKNYDTGIMAAPITCNPPKSHQCLQGMGWVREVDGKVTLIGKTVLE